MKKLIYLFFLLLLSSPLYSQQITQCKHVEPEFKVVRDGKVHESVVLKKGEENRLRIELPECVQKIRHKVYVSSNNAKITRDEHDNQEYLVTPLKGEKVQIIVDVETYEGEPKRKRKGAAKVVREVSGQRYMIAYENFAVY